jgi:hypothetical protein
MCLLRKLVDPRDDRRLPLAGGVIADTQLTDSDERHFEMLFLAAYEVKSASCHRHASGSTYIAQAGLQERTGVHEFQTIGSRILGEWWLTNSG